MRKVGGFLRVLRFPPPIKLTATVIVDSGVKHHQTNKPFARMKRNLHCAINQMKRQSRMENVRLFKFLSGRIGFILFLNARVELVSSELPKAITFELIS